MARFVTSHDNRLNEHFRTILERCETAYKNKKANLAMPTSDFTLDVEHRQLAAAVRDLLDEPSKDIIDTEQYEAALRSLNSTLQEGYLHTRQLNAELWSKHFRKALDRCRATYKARKENLAMPVTESDLESEHKQLAGSIRDLLNEQSSDLVAAKDTDAYRGALA